MSYTQLAGMYLGYPGDINKQPYHTATPIWIYDKDEQLRLILDPTGQGEGKIPHYNSWYEEELNGMVNLQFTTPAGHPDVEWIMNDGRAVIRDREGDLVEFILRQPTDRNGNDGPEKEVEGEGGDYELIDEWIGGYKADNVTLKQALTAVLSSTRIQPGIIDDFGTQSVDIEPTTVKNAVYQLINLFGGERKYRVQADGPDISARYLDVLHRRGFDTGHRFEIGRNVLSSQRIMDSTGIKTALYGYGASGENDAPRINFADVEWIKANGDPVDKPLGQTWVGDPDALQQWGYDKGRRHRFGGYSGQEEDPGELLLNTWKELQKVNDVVTTYDFQVAILDDRVRLGDNCYAIDHKVQPNINTDASVIRYRQNLNDYNLDEVTLGDYRKTFDAIARIRDVEQVVQRDRGNWDKKETPAGAQAKAESEAQAALNLAQEEIDEANLRIDQAVIDIDAAEVRLSDAEADISNAQIRLTEAETNIGNAEADIDNLIMDLNQAETDITSAQSLINSVTDNRNGLNVLSGTLVTNEIIAENAILTGTFTGSAAVFNSITTNSMTAVDATIQDATLTGILDGFEANILNLTTENMTAISADIVNGTIAGTLTANEATILNLTTDSMVAIDADIQNATITGTLSGVTGTFVGDLRTEKDAYIGNTLYVGEGNPDESKAIILNDTSTIETFTSPALNGEMAGIHFTAFDYIFGNDYSIYGRGTSKFYTDLDVIGFGNFAGDIETLGKVTADGYDFSGEGTEPPTDLNPGAQWYGNGYGGWGWYFKHYDGWRKFQDDLGR